MHVMYDRREQLGTDRNTHTHRHTFGHFKTFHDEYFSLHGLMKGRKGITIVNKRMRM